MKPNLWCVMDSFKSMEAAARSKIVSVSINNYSDPNPRRTSKRKTKREQLKAIFGRFQELTITDYKNMLIAQFNDD